MIAKGNLHAHGAKLAAYLTTSSGDETAELVELRGFAATNIRDAFIDVQIQAGATKATKPFFHAYVRAPEGEKLSREEWQTFADRLERQLGFGDQPRAVAFHHGADGESHMHIAWSRIDLASLTVIDPGLYKNKMKQLCRDFEQEFGLTKVANERGEDVKTKSAARAEFEQSRRLGTDLKAIRNTIKECWQSADSGQAFAAALAEHGLILAKGDRRAYVIIDHKGGDHALSKHAPGHGAGDAAAHGTPTAPVCRALSHAKAMQRERPAQEPRQEQRTAQRTQATATRKRSSPPTPARHRHRQPRGAARPAGARGGAARRGRAAQAQMHSARNYREQMERDAEAAKKNETERQRQDSSRAAAGDIADARSRYAQALGSTYDIRDPYGSLANAAMVEYGSFHRQQDSLRKKPPPSKSPTSGA